MADASEAAAGGAGGVGDSAGGVAAGGAGAGAGGEAAAAAAGIEPLQSLEQKARVIDKVGGYAGELTLLGTTVLGALAWYCSLRMVRWTTAVLSHVQMPVAAAFCVALCGWNTLIHSLLELRPTQFGQSRR